MRHRTKKGERQIARSGISVCPVCESKRLMVLHHIHGRDIGKDWDKAWNRCWICASCHDDIHSGRIEIEGWVTTTKRKELVWHKSGEEDKVFPAARPKLYNKKKDEKELFSNKNKKTTGSDSGESRAGDSVKGKCHFLFSDEVKHSERYNSENESRISQGELFLPLEWKKDIPEAGR